MRARANKKIINAYQGFARLARAVDCGPWTLDCSTCLAYAQSVSIQKNAHSTSLRSATQATDSTCSGCHAKSAATNALRQVVRVMRLKTRKSKTLLAPCSITFVR